MQEEVGSRRDGGRHVPATGLQVLGRPLAQDGTIRTHRRGSINKTPPDGQSSGSTGDEIAPGEVTGEVRAEPLTDFLSDVDQAGVYRLNLDAGQRAQLIAYAEAAAAAHTPFDRGYSIDSENNLYCTELVWRAMSSALERDAIPKKSRSVGRVYIALSDLSLHPLAREVLSVGAPG